MRISSLAVSLLFFAGVAHAQKASYSFFGKGSSVYQPYLGVTGTPALGKKFTATMLYRNPPGGGFPAASWWTAFMITGTSNQRIGSIPLPMTIRRGLQLLVSPDVIQVRLVRSGYAGSPPYWGRGNRSGIDFSYQVPNTRALLGLKLYQQMILTDAAFGTSVLFVATNGGALTVGY
jgi:hypothetical protein